MAEVTDTTGLSVSTGINQGQAQVYKDNTADQFSTWAKNYYTQNAEKEKLAEANKRIDDKENLKKFETDYAYSNSTWQPFEDELQRQVTEMKTELSNGISQGQEYKVGTDIWKNTQAKKDKIEAFAKKGKDLQLQYDALYKHIDTLDDKLYDKAKMKEELMQLAKTPLDSIEKFDIDNMSKIAQRAQYKKLDGFLDRDLEKLQYISSKKDIAMGNSTLGYTKSTEYEYPSFIVTEPQTFKDRFGKEVTVQRPKINSETGQYIIDTKNPEFVKFFVEGQSDTREALNIEVNKRTEEMVAKGIPVDQIDREELRREILTEQVTPKLKIKVSEADKDLKDNTVQMAQLAEQKRQFNERMAWDKAQAGNGAGTATPAVAAINDLAKLMNKDSDRFTSTEVIGGREYRVADASNVFGGNLDKKGSTGGRKLTKILIDVETGQLKYVDNKDKNNPKDLPENDFALLDNLLLSNLDAKERQAAINWLEQKGAYDKNTGKMNFSVLKDATVGQTGTGRDTQTFEAAKKSITSTTGDKNRDFVAKTKQLFENYKGKADLEYKGETYTDVEIDYEGDVEGAGDDIRLYGKDKNGNKVEIGTNMFKDIKQEDIPKILEGFKFKGESQEPAKQEQKTSSKTEAPKTTGRLKLPPPTN